MKKTFVLTFFFLGLLYPLLSREFRLPQNGVITKEWLVNIISMMDTPSAFQEAMETAVNNPEILEEIIFWQTDSDIVTGRMNAFRFLNIATWQGKFSKERFFLTAVDFLIKSDTLIPPRYLAQRKASIINSIQNYFIRFETPSEAIDSLIELLNALTTKELITNDGITKSLQSKLNSAKSKLENKQATPAINILDAANNEIIAQRGKNVTEVGATILNGYINNLIDQINGNSKGKKN